MNTVQMIGRLTKDVQIRQAGQNNVGNFTLAVNRPFKNKQTGEYEADFIMCQVWGKQAETLAQYTKKGSQIGVEGRIQTRNYENDQGQRVYVTEVVVDRFHFLDPINNNNNQGQQAQGQSGQYQTQQQQGQAPQNQGLNIQDEDLPF